MRKIARTVFMVFIAGFAGGIPSSCDKTDDLSQDGANVTLQVDVEDQGNETAPSAEESAIHTLRVYAFVDGTLVGYYYNDEDLDTPATFLMDMTLRATTTQKVDFYVVANEAAISTTGGTATLSKSTSESALNRMSFNMLHPENGLPMYYKGSHTIDVSQKDPDGPDESAINPSEHEGHVLLAQKLSFSLKRPVAKLGVFAAKAPGETAKLAIMNVRMLRNGTQVLNYMMPQSVATLEEVASSANDIELPISDAEIGEFAGDATLAAERRDTSRYTKVLAAPFYPFENPWGADPLDPAYDWSVPVSERSNVVQIDYRFDDNETLSGLVYLPKTERNRYYTVCCLIHNSGRITIEYLVADWSDAETWENIEFAYPSYQNPLLPFNGEEADIATLYPDGPTVWHDANDPEAGAFKLRFKMTEPIGEPIWTPTIVNYSEQDFEVKIYSGGTRIQPPVAASNDYYTICVIAKNPDNIGAVARLGIVYIPSWLDEKSFLLINGDPTRIAWPNSGQLPEIIEIRQVEQPTNNG